MLLSETHPLLLGSASPRRSELLRRLGLPFLTLAPEVDEALAADEAPDAYLERVVAAKLRAVAEAWGRRSDVRAPQPAAILVADTSVILEQRVLGKPADAAEARAMLAALSGRSHRVATRFALGALDGRVLGARTVSTTVWFRAARDHELDAYADSGEGLDKAGAYAVQGLGSFLVERIDGSWDAVVGLPSAELVTLLLELGVLERFPRVPR